jgi:hypothetical protein
LQTPDFNNIFLDAIDQSLSVLGESSKTSIYFHLEKTYGVKKQDIPQKPEDFIVAMEKLFGPGSKFIANLILRSLCQKTGLNVEEGIIKNLSFAETLSVVRKMMERSA